MDRYSKINMANRDELIEIYRDTVDYCKKQKFIIFTPIKYNYNQLDDSLNFRIPSSIAQVRVYNSDSFDLAMKLIDSDSIPFVLNLASYKNPGGGVIRGARAQEEDLFRRSNYFQTLHAKLYPMQKNEAIYSKAVYIIKDNNYKLLYQPVIVSCLALAAIYNPEIEIGQNGLYRYKHDADRDIMRRKIDFIFQIALKNNHKNLVLGALGCGAYNNPPEEVALIFKNAVEKYKFYFQRIYFAVLARPESKVAIHNFNVYSNILDIKN